MESISEISKSLYFLLRLIQYDPNFPLMMQAEGTGWWFEENL